MFNSQTPIIKKKKKKHCELLSQSHKSLPTCITVCLCVLEWISLGHFLMPAPMVVQTPPPSFFPRPRPQNGLHISHSVSSQK